MYKLNCYKIHINVFSSFDLWSVMVVSINDLEVDKNYVWKIYFKYNIYNFLKTLSDFLKDYRIIINHFFFPELVKGHLDSKQLIARRNSCLLCLE